MKETYSREEVIQLLKAFGANCCNAGKQIMMVKDLIAIGKVDVKRDIFDSDDWIERNLK